MKTPASPEDKAFSKQLGERITTLRKEQGLTQAQLAGLVGYSQQQIDSFEKGRRRMYAAALSRFAMVFGVSVEDLLGGSGKPGKRGPASKLQQQLERLSRLPRSKQRVVTEMIEIALQRAQG